MSEQLPQEQFLDHTAKGVPHETGAAARQMSFSRWLKDPTLEIDSDMILEATFDAPGYRLKGNQIVGTIKEGEGLKAVKNREPRMMPAMGYPCPAGCGGKLDYINAKVARCDTCGTEFDDTKA